MAIFNTLASYFQEKINWFHYLKYLFNEETDPRGKVFVLGGGGGGGGWVNPQHPQFNHGKN
jgi:hypothetical protein